MKIPDFPSRDGQTIDDTIVELMDSIAKEEIALSNLLNSESKKIDAFVGKNFDFPTCPSNEQILSFNKSVHKITEAVLMKEWLLYQKLITVIDLNDNNKEKHKKDCNE